MTSPRRREWGRIRERSILPRRRFAVKRFPGLLTLALSEDAFPMSDTDQIDEDEVLRRMLNTPPKPHKPAKPPKGVRVPGSTFDGSESAKKPTVGVVATFVSVR